MPQLLKSFKPQLVNTSSTSAILFIQTFLTNPKTAIQDTVDQVKPENLIVKTVAGYDTESVLAKEEEKLRQLKEKLQDLKRQELAYKEEKRNLVAKHFEESCDYVADITRAIYKVEQKEARGNEDKLGELVNSPQALRQFAQEVVGDINRGMKDESGGGEAELGEKTKIVKTVAGYDKEPLISDSNFAPHQDTYSLSSVDYINNFLRYKREHSPLEFKAWKEKNNVPMSSPHPISQDKTQKDHAVLIQEDSLLFSKQQLKQGADRILKYLKQSSPSAGVLSLPDGCNIALTHHAEHFFIFDPRGSLTQYSQQELLSFLMQQQHLTFAPLRPGPRLALEPFHDRLFATSSSSSFFKSPAPSAPPQQPVSALLINVDALVNTNGEYNDSLIPKILNGLEGAKRRGLLTNIVLLSKQHHSSLLISNLIKYLQEKGISVDTVSMPDINKQTQIIKILNKLNKDIFQNDQCLKTVIYVGNEEADVKESFVGAMKTTNIQSITAYYGSLLLTSAAQQTMLKQIVAFKAESQAPTTTAAPSYVVQSS